MITSSLLVALCLLSAVGSAAMFWLTLSGPDFLEPVFYFCLAMSFSFVALSVGRA